MKRPNRPQREGEGGEEKVETERHQRNKEVVGVGKAYKHF